MKYHFCTYFDSNYFMYGYTLFRSLKKTGIDFTLYVCCLDDSLYENLIKLNQPEIIPVRFRDIEEWDPEFSACKNNRNRIEYYFTLSPVLPLYILTKYPGIDILAYMDSDLYFYSSPAPIYQILGNKSVLIVEHDSYKELKYCEDKIGKYNMAFQLYRNDPQGNACLRHWRKECIEWCYDHPENGKFADQKYLEEWPEKFDAVVLPDNIGGGLAPWNYGMHRFDLSNPDHPKVDQHDLIYFHYQQAKIVGFGIMVAGSKPAIFYARRDIHDFIYGTYYRELCKSSSLLQEKIGSGCLSMQYTFNREKHCQTTKRSWLKKFLQVYIKKIPWLFSGVLVFHGKRFFAITFPMEKFLYFHKLKK